MTGEGRDEQDVGAVAGSALSSSSAPSAPLTRFGFHYSSISYADIAPAQLFARIVDVAVAAERAGFDSLWVPDHVHQNQVGGGPSGPMLEAYTFLGALAARTQSVKLGSLVSPVTLRFPAVLAKTITTLDVISDGRAVLGIGAGWDRAEHDAYGVPFPLGPERWERLTEAVEICRALFAGGPVDYAGSHYTLDGAWNAPRPLQSKLPLLIGGGGEKLTLPIVAKYADACNFFGGPEVIAEKLEVLRRHCEAVGRDFAAITKTSAVFGPESAAAIYETAAKHFAVGVDGVVLFAANCPSPATVTEWGDALQRAFRGA